jgi:DNA-binding beta-propeller fold protein YncE
MSQHSKVRTFILGGVSLCVVVVGSAILSRAQTTSATASPGPRGDGSTLLPNGWRLAPAGLQLPVGDLPLNLITSADGKYVIVTNNGLARPSISVVDIAKWTVTSTMVLDQAWFGLVWHPDGTKLYSSGAAQNNIQEFSYADGVLTRARTFALPGDADRSFAGGLAISRDGQTLYVTRLFAMTVSAIDLASGQVSKTTELPAEPYTSLLSADGRYLFVSLWGGSAVQIFDARTLQLVNEIATGEHPNALLLSPDGRRLFVACGNTSDV